MAHPGGRPTDYDPAFCDIAIEFLRKGKSRIQLCEKLDIAKSTMQLWEKIHPEFSAALEKGITFSESKWHTRGESNLKNNKYNTKMYELQMRNRYGWDKQKSNEPDNKDNEIKDIQEARKQYDKAI